MYLRKPNADQIRAWIDSQAPLDFTYSFVGATKSGSVPSNHNVDHNRIQLGSGLATFEAAKEALSLWKHFQIPWVELHPPSSHVAANVTVGILARAMGVYSLNACRVVYVIEEEDPFHRFAFGYGTLPEHPESGEERFQVEHRSDDTVWFDILAYSRPYQLLAHLAYPYVRHKQKQFASGSMQAMQTAVNAKMHPSEGG